MINGHGGNIYKLAQDLKCSPSEIIDMSSNVNPLGPPAGLIEFLRKNINLIDLLPEVDAGSAVHAFAAYHNVNPDLVIPGNGTTQLIYNIPLGLNTKKALIIGPTYADYADACEMHKTKYDFFYCFPGNMFDPDIKALKLKIKDYDTIFICNPNNPTGRIIPPQTLKELFCSNPDAYFILDESYLPFVENAGQYTMINCSLPNLIVLNSMSKIFRVPGLRIGFMTGSKPVIKKLSRYAMPWSVNSLAQAAVVWLMENNQDIQEFIQNTRTFLQLEREKLEKDFYQNDSIRFFQSCTSFMLAELSPGHHNAEILCNILAKNKILIRNCSNFKGLSDRFIRISLKDGQINRLLRQKLLEIF
ncbi:putative threonine-phosphate decarboxylase, CobD-like [Desulfonema limicola]|uniref:Threonine-phosphate decarboxylase, CobD-like n=1 Tax=Desulfonema limicola TaxID=45656 RepID=A0A975GGP2_9BACT|nr:aminotransferase class I/II-fold pyridoxal phosphate-dependent enzyme [Desulfonema limicola]QTA80458.1 putative threonine-phosphate decarboxylase, CobD-like [Desulfonema limicola]